MKPEDIERGSHQLINFLSRNVVSQADALAIGGEVLNEKGLELLKAHPWFKGLDET